MKKAAISLAILSLVSGVSSPQAAERRFRWTAADAEAVAAKVQEGAFGTVSSVLILHEGNPVFERYFNGTSAATLHDTRSVTKTITGMAVGRAIADGALTLDTRVARFFGDISPFENDDPRKAAITVEDLLTMSGPLECDDWNTFSRGNEERMYVVEDWPSFFWNLPIRGYPAWATKPADAPYGRSFSYCTAGVQVLGEVVQRASGVPFTEYVEKKLFAPLGIDVFEWPRNGVGQAHMGGGLRLTTRALGVFAELQRNRGRLAGHQVLPAAWTDAAVMPYAVIPNTGWEYGYLWWLSSFTVDGVTYRAASMNGNGGNRVTILPDFGISVVFTKTDYNTPGMHEDTTEFFENEIVGRLSGE